ncbi:hypothetical protein AB205_0125780, partial [Aquarana catesbeiana]
HVRKATKERHALTATKRGQSGSVSTVDSAGCGHSASSACDRGACLSFFSAAGRVIEPQHAEELVEWITKPSSSSSSSPPSCTEEFPELFDHSVGYILQEDVQRFEGSDDGTQVEEGSNVSLEKGGAQEVQETGSHVPRAAAYCQVSSSDEEGGNDEVTGSTWLSDRREKEEETHLQQGRMPSRGQLKGSHPIASRRRAKQVQGAADSLHILKSSL